MGGLASAALLSAVAVACGPAALALAAAGWPRRCPAAAILLWQALGLCWGLAAVGALAGAAVTPHRAGIAGGVVALGTRVAAGQATAAGQAGQSMIITGLRLAALAAAAALLAVLCGILIAAAVDVLRARHRHRAMLALLAHGDPRLPGALVVDHPAAAAYCVPGRHSQIVVSAGTLALLDGAELAAVVAHERAHLRERHDLVLLPFSALLRAFGWSQAVTRAHTAVALLVEMLADDMARKQGPARELATALLRFGVAGGTGPPSGALAAAPAARSDVAARVSRLLEPAPRLSRPAFVAVSALAILLAAVPAALLVVPL